ncbi:MAG: hypothetical protein K2P84_11010 [Undibacterium sp.]|nr:hypothetical protein [Undibacterium sp.]
MLIEKNDHGWICGLILLGMLSVLTGCANTPTTSTPVAPTHQQATGTRIGDAITSPLNDFNLIRTEIPEALVNARKAPYAKAKDVDCDWLKKEISSLDLVLGPDIDAVQVDGNGNVIERGTEELGNAAINAMKGFAEGVVPFRAWIRRLTGADKHAKDLVSAGVAGVVRRAYLKGVANTMACPIETSKLALPNLPTKND